MSNAGRGKPNIPPTFKASNGPSTPEVPADLIWDEDNPPVIYPCSQDINHDPTCPGNEPGLTLDSELQVMLLNEARAWARAGMSFNGIPAAYQNVIPKPGIAVELVDLLIWLQVIKDVVVELSDISEFDFEEKFRERKLSFLQEIRFANEANIRKARVANSIGIVEKPPLLGPDGQPI